MTVAYNTFVNAREISNRHGAGNLITHNHLSGNSGIRIIDADHLVLNNRLVGNAELIVFNGDVLSDEEGGNSANWPEAVYPRPYRTLLYNNHTERAPAIGARFSTGQPTMPPKDTVIRAHIGTLPTLNFGANANPAGQWRADSGYPVDPVPQLAESDVGINADRWW